MGDEAISLTVHEIASLTRPASRGSELAMTKVNYEDLSRHNWMQIKSKRDRNHGAGIPRGRA